MTYVINNMSPGNGYGNVINIYKDDNDFLF